MPGAGFARQPILERNRSLTEKKSYKNPLSKHLLKIYPLGIPKISSDLSLSTLSQSSSDSSFSGSLRQWDRRISDTIRRLRLIQRKESPAPEVKKEEISGTTDDIIKRCTWITKTSGTFKLNNLLVQKKKRKIFQIVIKLRNSLVFPRSSVCFIPWSMLGGSCLWRLVSIAHCPPNFVRYSTSENWLPYFNYVCRQLFELLTLSGMLMDQKWTEILKKKELYRWLYIAKWSDHS